MAKDNFKDEFEKSKQPVERQDDLKNEDLVFEGEDFSGHTEEDDFPKRGVSRRSRSAERRRREESVEETEEKSKKKRRRKGAAAGAGAAAAVTHGDIEKPAAAGEVKSTTYAAGDGEPEVHHVDEERKEEKGNKWLPLLAGLLILIPILFLLFMFFGNKDDNDKNGSEKTATTEEATTEKVTTEAATTEVPAAEKTTTEAATTEVPAAEKTTTEAVTTETTTTETTTAEQATTEAPTAEQATTEAPTAEQATTEAPTATRGGTTHTVGANENLYRIAIRYYGSGTPANVEKIRQANGLNGNTLSIGQELVIPK